MVTKKLKPCPKPRMHTSLGFAAQRAQAHWLGSTTGTQSTHIVSSTSAAASTWPGMRPITVLGQDRSLATPHSGHRDPVDHDEAQGGQVVGKRERERERESERDTHRARVRVRREARLAWQCRKKRASQRGQRSNTIHSRSSFNVCSCVNLARHGANAVAPPGPSLLPDNTSAVTGTAIHG